MNIEELMNLPKSKKDEILNDLQKAVDAGHVESMLELAKSYYNGILSEKDLKQAFMYYKMAADNGDITGKLNIFYMYIQGEGVEKNLNEATKLAKVLEQSSDAETLFQVGSVYEQGYLGEVNIPKAFDCYMKSANLGNHNGQLKVGNFYAEGKLFTEDWDAAVNWWTKSAQQGNKTAKKVLQDFADEIKIKTNSNDMTKEFKKVLALAEDGDVKMQMRLAQAYKSGLGTPADLNKSFAWYEKAGDNGEPLGYFRCAKFYSYGFFEDDNNHTKEREYLLKASNLGLGEADDCLNALDVDSEGSKKQETTKTTENTQKTSKKTSKTSKKVENTSQEVKNETKYELVIDYKKYNQNKQKYFNEFNANLQKAVNGDAKAMFKVGETYYIGYFGLYNIVSARTWFNNAIEAGNYEGYVGLGRLEYFTHDYARNLDKAAEYFNLAASKGSLLARKWLARINLYFKDEELGLKELKEVAKLNCPSANIDLAYYYLIDNVDLDKAEIYINKAIELGDIGASYLLARLHYGRKEYDKFLKEIAISIEEGESYAEQDIAFMYFNGTLFQQDYIKAFNWFNRSAMVGNAQSNLYLGICYEFGYGCEIDYNKALYHYEIAAKRGNYQAQNNTANFYLNGRGCEMNEEKAFLLYQKATEGEYVYAFCNLAICYLNGYGCKKDYKKAIYYLKKGAEYGDTLAMYYLGFAYSNGYGCDVDHKEAFNWYSKAARTGDVKSIHEVGFMLLNGIGCEVNTKEAFKMFEKAASEDYPESVAMLGDCYTQGSGVEINIKKAHYYHEKAASLGVATSMLCCALNYQVGNGVKRDYIKAVSYHLEAMKKGCLLGFNKFVDFILKVGNSKKFYKDILLDLEEVEHELAWHLIGELCCKGEIVDQDYEKAYKYLTKASEKGYDESIRLRDMVFTKQGTVKNYIKTSNQKKEAIVDLSDDNIILAKDLINKGYSLSKFTTSNALLTYTKKGHVDRYIQAVKSSMEISSEKLKEHIESFELYATDTQDDHLLNEVGKLVSISGAALVGREWETQNLKRRFSPSSENK